jgi:hypothetical protein
MLQENFADAGRMDGYDGWMDGRMDDDAWSIYCSQEPKSN